VSRLTQTSIKAFLVLVGSATIGFFAQVGIARMIGAESFGTYAYVLSWAMLLGYLSTLGFNVSLLKLVPAYRAREEWHFISGVMRFAKQGTIVAGLVVFALFAVLAYRQYGVHSELGVAAIIGLVSVPLIAMRLVGAAGVRVFGGIIAAMVPERLVRDSLTLVFLSVALASGIFPADAVTAMAATLLSAVLTLALVSRFMRQIRPERLASQPPAYSRRDWIKPTLPLTMIMVADVLMGRSGVLVLGLRGYILEAGIFAVAFSVALLTALPRMAVSNMFAPTVSDLYARGDFEALQDLIAKSACLSLAGTLALALPLAVVAPFVLSLFGSEFTVAAPVVVILVAGQLFAAAAGPQQHLVTMTGHEWAGAAMMGAFACINLVGSFLAVGPFGMVGAAAVSAGSVIAWNIAMGWFVFKKLGIRPGLVAAFQTHRLQRAGVGAKV
jgi:O-antigen/teichoic acid export membrane protein